MLVQEVCIQPFVVGVEALLEATEVGCRDVHDVWHIGENFEMLSCFQTFGACVCECACTIWMAFSYLTQRPMHALPYMGFTYRYGPLCVK